MYVCMCIYIYIYNYTFLVIFLKTRRGAHNPIATPDGARPFTARSVARKAQPEEDNFSLWGEARGRGKPEGEGRGNSRIRINKAKCSG